MLSVASSKDTYTQYVHCKLGVLLAYQWQPPQSINFAACLTAVVNSNSIMRGAPGGP